MKKGLMLIFTFLFLTVYKCFSQTTTILGKITDDNEPFDGTSVMIKDTKVGITTKVGGEFSFAIPGNAFLFFSYLAFQFSRIQPGDV
jgi:hypothetical protein